MADYKDIVAEIHDLRKLLAPDPLGGFTSLDPERTSSAIIEDILDLEDKLTELRRSFKDGGAVRPNNPLNRKMFQQPIRAQSGVYVPTIEQIMNFYQGGFDQAGQPTDTESFLRAIEATKLMNEKGFFPGEGEPLKFTFFPDNKDGIQEILKQTDLDRVESMGFGQRAPEGDAYQALIDQAKNEQIAGIMAAAASDPSQRQQPVIDSLLREGALTGTETLEAPEAGRRDVAKDLIREGIGNLSGTPTGQPVTSDENIEMIKRNILQGTNIVERGTPEYEALSAVEKMKVDDAVSKQKREEVDLTDASKDRLKNFITAAGDSAETAILIYNDMLNAGGEIAESAGEVLEGWKEAFSEGFTDDQKKSLNEQLEYLKSQSKDAGNLGAPIFGVDMETLQKGGENIKEWFKKTVLPEMVEGGLDIAQNIFGASDLGVGSDLPPELQTGTVAATVDPRLASGISEDQDKAIDLADRVPNDVMANIAERIGPFETKVKDTVTETKELVTEGLTKIKDLGNKLQEVAPKTYEIMEKEINSLTEKVKNNKINTKEFNESLDQIKDNIIDLTSNLSGDVKEGVLDVVDNVKDTITGLTSTESTKSSTYVDPDKRVAEPITQEELEKFKVKKADGEEIPVDSEEAVTGTIESGAEVDNLDTSANQVADGSDKKSTDGNVLASTADTTGELGSGNMNDLISQTLKEAGYNLNTVKDPDADALKMVYYGTLLATTPGEFKDAAMQNLNRFVKDEINAKYKSAAQKQKFKGDVFKILLAGKLDILKEQAKTTKGVSLKSPFLPGATAQNDMVQSVMVNKFGIDVDIDDDDATQPTNDFINAVKSKAAQYMTEARTGDVNLNYEDAVSQAVNDLIPLFTTEEVDNEGLLRKYTPGKFLKNFLFGEKPEGTTKITGRLKGTDPATIQAVIQAVKDQRGITITKEEAIQLISEYPGQ